MPDAISVDLLRAHLYVADHATPSEIAAASNIAARLAFENPSIQLPVGLPVSSYSETASALAIIVGNAAIPFSGRLEKKLLLFPDLQDAELFARTLGSELGTEINTKPGDNRMDDSFRIVLGPDSQDIEIINTAARVALESNELHLPLVVVRDAAGPLPSPTFPNLYMQPGPTLFNETYSLPWEAEDAYRRIEETVLPMVHPGSAVDIELRLSESPEMRAAIAQRIRDTSLKAGADASQIHVRVLAAHKQAYCWLDEIVKTRLQARESIATIRILYRESETDNIESPQRWLHELYPIDEVLARDLGIPVDRITFHPTTAATYSVLVEDANGHTVFSDSFEPRFATRPLFDWFPDYAQVRHGTGWLHAIVDGTVVCDERILTDPEKFWNSYQSALGGLTRIVEHAPKLATLEVDLWLSEPDYRIGIDEERISTLESLHEDIYFETLLFFELLGLKQPPRIIPRVHPSRDGEPGTVQIQITTQGPYAFVKTPRIEPLPVTASPGMPIVQMESPIGPEECEQIIRRLAAYPEVHAYCAGISALGRPIWVMEVTKPSSRKPTIFITGRQHANEVSSTTHILLLAEKLVTDPETRTLLDRINFVLQPIVNPDGAALVEELHRDTPGFMLHAGYWGAHGIDVTREQWSENPRCPEARVRPAIWKKWQPDIVLNPHGYPSHEWVQMFAGYTAWVKSRNITARDWWIPRGWFIPRFEYMEESRDAAFAFRDHLMATMKKILGPWHERMQRRHAKYGAATTAAITIEKALQHDPDGFTFMQRHPDVTFMELVTEAPDEVASGEWLKVLTLAGLECSLAAARWLAANHRPFVRTVQHGVGTTVLRITRERP